MSGKELPVYEATLGGGGQKALGTVRRAHVFWHTFAAARSRLLHADLRLNRQQSPVHRCAAYLNHWSYSEPEASLLYSRREKRIH